MSDNSIFERGLRLSSLSQSAGNRQQLRLAGGNLLFRSFPDQVPVEKVVHVEVIKEVPVEKIVEAPTQKHRCSVVGACIVISNVTPPYS